MGKSSRTHTCDAPDSFSLYPLRLAKDDTHLRSCRGRRIAQAT
jgi:hypothetical protein